MRLLSVQEQLKAPELRQLVEQLRSDSRGRQDAQTLPYFERELEQVLSETYDREYPQYKMANGDVISITSEVDEGAETFTYYMYDHTGIAEFVTAYAGNDMPMVTIEGAKVTAPVEPMAIGYVYTTRDVRNGAFTGKPLSRMLPEKAKMAHDARLHITGLWGRDDLGIEGFVNHPNITVGDAPAGSGGGGNPEYWENKTPDEIVEDFATVIDGVNELTNEVEFVTKVAIALPQFNYIKRTRLGTLGESVTILEYLQKIWSGVEFYPLVDLQATKSQGNLSSNSMIAYNADPRKVRLEVPMPFRQYPVQNVDLKFKVPTESSTGGVVCPYPLSIYRLDGIGSS